MKSFVDYLNEELNNGVSNEFVYTVYDDFDKTVVNVFNTEEEAKKAADEYNKQAEENKAVIKKEKRSTVER